MSNNTGRLRLRTQPQKDNQIVREQKGFLGGMTLDVPRSEIGDNQTAKLENLIPFRDRLETRPGTEEFGSLNLIGVGDLHNTFYHEGVRKYVAHIGEEIYASDDALIWNIVSGTQSPLDAPSTIRAIKKNVVIFQDGRAMILELNNQVGGPSLRLLNSSNPDNVLQLSDEGAGDFTYRFLYTFARFVDEILVAESGTIINAVANQSDYTEVRFSNPIGGGALVTINSFTKPTEGITPPGSTQWTHIIVYRTLNVGANSTNNTEAYYKTDTIPIDEVAASGGIGVFIIGSTFIVSANQNGLNTSDADLIVSGSLSKTRFFEPLPDGLIGEVMPAYIFIGQDNGDTVSYSSIEDVPERAGYFFPGSQFEDLDDGLKAFVRSPDSILTICNSRTYRGTTQTYQDVGIAELGQSIPSIYPFTLVDDTTGVVNVGSIAMMDQGRFIAHCSDDTIRVWDGLQWGTDLARQKITKELRTIVPGSSAIFHPDGYYVLWYRTDGSSIATTKTLRLGTAEDVGIGWTFYNGPGWIQTPINTGALRIIDDSTGKMRLLAVDDNNRKIYWIETFDGPTGSGLSRTNIDRVGTEDHNVPTSAEFSELLGARESFNIIHQESHVYIRPIDRDGAFESGLELSLSAFEDDNALATDTFTNITPGGDIHLGREVSAQRIRLKVSSNKAGFSIVSYDTLARSQDRSTLAGSPNQDIQTRLTTGLIFWANGGSPKQNALKTFASGDKIGTEVGTVSLVSGPTSKAETALRFS